MQRNPNAGSGANVLPLLRHAAHGSPPLGCDYRSYGDIAYLRWPHIRARVEAGGEELQQLFSCVDGALTGLNMALHDTFDISPFLADDTLPVVVLDVSEANPLWPLHAVVLEVARILAPLRARTDGPSVTLVVAGRRLRLRECTLRLIQGALSARGFLAPSLVGCADGARLESALLAFQGAEGLTLSGLPDALTLAHLARPSP
ncbi:MAG: hypothetical protein GC150_17365 [Rhizobiales bacterium]|nr:hypothetical protein [Hyphomicrobiales bacterium]